jgi:hypothetical protein
MRAERCRGRAADGIEFKARGIVDQTGQRSRLGDQPGRHVRVAEVSQQQRRAQFIGDGMGLVAGRAGVQHHRVAGCHQRARQPGAQAAGAAGDQDKAACVRHLSAHKCEMGLFMGSRLKSIQSSSAGKPTILSKSARDDQHAFFESIENIQ